ncbi:uncharacterized protein B0H18DRAFT_878449 [Fomitopsis serialis]|uniref:uncharacterized protein n=1 Tax=Fomitopsis serialis TaxID=139415 RepID=UPI002007B340|nr:uncharacterized protein B0H18DRAFT_878449 [Neoantrodia serialis]KAH9923673.1 hypothetical protein B0H18DRAFT_878449 [Neoantrodia serialis]
MPRENSFTDSEGRSLTPDLEEAMMRETELHRSDSPEPIVATEGGQPRQLDPDVVSAPDLPSSQQQASTARSPARPDFDNVLPRAFTTPGDRFRTTVRKVMAMNRTASSVFVRPGIGAEPGVDPRRASANMAYSGIKQKCVIEVVDYSTLRVSFGRMTNNEFIKMLRDPSASRRDPWVRVRWINVGGISWDVISALALKYDMHPLAIEDILSQRQHSRSKADYYPQHLFLRVLCHSLTSDDYGTPDSSVTNLPRSESPDLIGIDDSDGEEEVTQPDDDRTVYGSASASKFSTKRGSLRNGAAKVKEAKDVEHVAMQIQQQQRLHRGEQKQAARHMRLIRELKKGDRVAVKVLPLCIFLFRDGRPVPCDVPDPSVAFTEPITNRLRQRHTGLRTSADASLLVQSLLDLIVDSALEVIEEYQTKILKIEQEVLLKPSMETVRRLHILQGDLILHKRTLEPIKTVIYGLRRYDDDRVAALTEKVDPSMKIQGYMSHKAKIYLADVHDHMEYILSSLEMFAGVSENLINYTFNMASYEMNEVMRRLTLATIIFLPLTLLTGYFGMNFENMWSIMHGHSDLIFWIIALPVMAIVVPLFAYPDLRNMVRYLQKRVVKQKVGRVS